MRWLPKKGFVLLSLRCGPSYSFAPSKTDASLFNSIFVAGALAEVPARVQCYACRELSLFASVSWTLTSSGFYMHIRATTPLKDDKMTWPQCLLFSFFGWRITTINWSTATFQDIVVWPTVMWTETEEEGISLALMLRSCKLQQSPGPSDPSWKFLDRVYVSSIYNDLIIYCSITHTHTHIYIYIYAPYFQYM